MPLIRLLKRLPYPRLSQEKMDALRDASNVNSAGFDPWGLHLETTERTVGYAQWAYRNYFKVRVHGIEKVPKGRVLLVPNHGGQLPLDGFFIGLSMILDAPQPRVVRGMVERWFPTLPFVSTLFTRCGQVVGDPENCVALLRRDQTILVFPEGTGGSGKTWWHRYRLQRFGTGFVRIALQTDAPIVPVAVIGAEETYPAVYNAKSLAKLMGAPYAPVTPFFPLLGPLGAIPLPVQVDLHFGDPITVSGNYDGPDDEVQGEVDRVRDTLQNLIDEGLEQRPDLKKLDRFVSWRHAL